MKVRNCLLCLKRVDEENSTSEETFGVPLVTKFLKFVPNYLQVTQVPSSEQLLKMSGGGETEVFCEKCELSVISPICQVYSQLVATQLRLLWEVEQLEKILQNSDCSTNLAAFTDQLCGSLFKKFRRTLRENCQQKRMEMLPRVLVQRVAMPVNQNQTDPNAKIKMEPVENHDYDDDYEGFDPDDTSHSLHSEEYSPSSDADRDRSNYDTHTDLPTSVKIENGLEETNDSTYHPDSSPPANTSPKKRTHGSGNMQFPCPNCSKIFPTSRKVKIHASRVHTERKFSCVKCKSRFKALFNLQEHFASIHNPQPQTCQDCGKVCKNKKAFRNHNFWVHSGQGKQQLKCPKCRRSYKHKHYLRRHLRRCAGVP